MALRHHSVYWSWVTLLRHPWLIGAVRIAADMYALYIQMNQFNDCVALENVSGML
jgi:hypothetical protein